MAYFGGGGVAGQLHPSLQVYVECYANPMMTKGWPRGGGIWDQDPVLVSHFRVIRNYERQWKESQEAIQGKDAGGEGLGSALDQYIKQLENEGESTAL